MQQEVHAVLRQSAEPMSAYAVMDELRKSNHKIAPPTIYRALSALVERGAVHRLESLNAFMACRCEGHPHESVISICGDCGTVEEQVAPEILERLSGLVGAKGFAPARHVIEVHGVCSACSDEGHRA